MNTLTIVGLSLLAPIASVFVTIFIVYIIDTIKRAPLEFIGIIITLMGIVGAILLCISYYL